jgi:sec-independent protein translocase protein TatB
MEIFGIGPFELALIALIAFIVLGPDRIPGVLRQLGRGVGRLRLMLQQLTNDYGQDLRQVTGEMSAAQADLRRIQRDLTEVARGLITVAKAEVPPSPAPDAAPDTLDDRVETPGP